MGARVSPLGGQQSTPDAPGVEQPETLTWVARKTQHAAAALFSAAHHVVGAEPWHIGAFVYRFLCGLIFATLFQVRGFAVAVYTHALYDVFVLTMHG